MVNAPEAFSLTLHPRVYLPYVYFCISFFTETPSTPFHASQYKPYEIEIEALALAQLQRKVKEAALNRTRQADARAAKSGFRSGSGGIGGGYKGVSGDVNLSYDANTGIDFVALFLF